MSLAIVADHPPPPDAAAAPEGAATETVSPGRRDKAQDTSRVKHRTGGLYNGDRLARILDAGQELKRVWVVENEAAVDQLQPHLPDNQVAVTAPGGLDNWTGRHSLALRWKRVVVWTDEGPDQIAARIHPYAPWSTEVIRVSFDETIAELRPDEPGGAITAMFEAGGDFSRINWGLVPPVSVSRSSDDDDPTITTSQLINLPAPRYLIDGILPANAISWLYSPPGIGKTFVALDMAAHLATGQTWHGRDIEQTDVYYVVAESPEGVGQRARAWTQHHERNPEDLDGSLHWCPRKINLFDYERTTWLVQKVEELHVGLVIVDTLAKCTVGADENLAKDMNRVIDNAGRIVDAGAAVLFIHHTGKDPGKGGRGSSVVLGAVDAELELVKLKDTFALRNNKQKNTPDAEQMLFKLTPVELPPDDDGTPRSSAVVEAVAGTPRDFRPTTIMERVSAELAQAMGQARSKSHLRREVRGKNEYIDVALEVLIAEGHVQRGPDGYRLVNAYVASSDPKVNPAAELQELLKS